MKIVVISDSHGNVANLKNVMGFAKKTNTSAVIHCGDWTNIKAVETVLEYGIPLYTVLGNADIDPKVRNLLASKATMFNDKWLMANLDQREMGIIHNFNYLPLTINHLSIVFTGHYHGQNQKTVDGVWVVNPGALEGRISFAIYDTKTNKVEFVNE